MCAAYLKHKYITNNLNNKLDNIIHKFTSLLAPIRSSASNRKMKELVPQVLDFIRDLNALNTCLTGEAHEAIDALDTNLCTLVSICSPLGQVRLKTFLELMNLLQQQLRHCYIIAELHESTILMSDCHGMTDILYKMTKIVLIKPEKYTQQSSVEKADDLDEQGFPKPSSESTPNQDMTIHEQLLEIFDDLESELPAMAYLTSKKQRNFKKRSERLLKEIKRLSEEGLEILNSQMEIESVPNNTPVSSQNVELPADEPQKKSQPPPKGGEMVFRKFEDVFQTVTGQQEPIRKRNTTPGANGYGNTSGNIGQEHDQRQRVKKASEAFFM